MPDTQTALSLSVIIQTAFTSCANIAKQTAVTLKNEDGTEQKTLCDTVFHLAGHTLKGDEPEGSYEQMSAALPLMEAETALAELEAAYDAG